MVTRKRVFGLLAALVFSGTRAQAELPPRLKEDAPLVVNGVVREVYSSVRNRLVDYVVEIEVRTAEAGPMVPPGAGLRLPQPGAVCYAHCFLLNPNRILPGVT